MLKPYKIMQRLYILLVWLPFASLLAQEPYTDYIGAGHNKGIIVTSSSDDERESFFQQGSGDKTISGKGLNAKYNEASRFLYQATFGPTEKSAQSAIDLGFEGWIEQQKTIPPSNVLMQADSFAKVLYNFYIAAGEDPDDVSDQPGWQHFRYAWWNSAINGKDQLRQRMAYTLSQIFVISDQTDLGGYARGMASYHDMLAKNAFGNYRDLLLDVTLHPCMGFYLSHLNNPKEIPEENIHPDQNYAREIMQLFSIGLYELNEDGSRKVDANGNNIPTYDNEDIAELAKVFTGLGIGTPLDSMDLYFGRGLYGSDNTKPMKMYEEWHQLGEKKLIQNITIPDGQDGMKDIEDAIDMLFNHPNTPPFICRQLIQRFVTSNPSPEYIARVVSVFKNDGSGERGNLYAVLKAILLDEEARSCNYVQNNASGKMSEPVLRYSNFLRTFPVSGSSKYFFNHAYNFQQATYQHPYSAQSVFNFYPPDYSPNGVINDMGLVAPEFKLLNSLTVLDFANVVFGWTYYEYSMNNWENDYFYSASNASKLFESAHDDNVLVNHIDQLFMHGSMSPEVRNTIKTAIKDIDPTLEGAKNKINMALYLALISPDFIIKK
jgi:uncharacterized protein (DUF1800 family)